MNEHSREQILVVDVDSRAPDLVGGGDKALTGHYDGKLNYHFVPAFDAAVNADAISSSRFSFSNRCVEKLLNPDGFYELHLDLMHSHCVPLTVFFLCRDHVTSFGNRTQVIRRRVAKYFLRQSVFRNGTTPHSVRATQQPAIASASQLQVTRRGHRSWDGVSSAADILRGEKTSTALTMRSGLKRNQGPTFASTIASAIPTAIINPNFNLSDIGRRSSSVSLRRSTHSSSQFLRSAAPTACACLKSTRPKRANAPHRGCV